MQPDVIAQIQLYTKEKGGRQGATPADKFSCIVRIAGRLHDCRFLLDEIGSLAPGDSREGVPLVFLNARAALEGVSEGEVFEIIERGQIGEGRISKIYKA